MASTFKILDHRGKPFEGGTAMRSPEGRGPGPRRMGYDAVENRGDRKFPVSVLRSEDREMWPYQRQILVTNSRDLQRNYSIAAWMIRKHLDFVSTFIFHPRTGDKGLDRVLAEYMAWYGRPENCDAAGRHTLAQMIRLGEARRTVDSDVFFQKRYDGKLNAIEGDRVRMPPGGVPPQDIPSGYSLIDFIHGVLVNRLGKSLAYVVCKRFKQGYGFLYERLVPAKYMRQHAYFDRFDQVRGVSPLASALNSLRDTYEGFNYALAKMKVTQLFALAFYREAAETVAPMVTADPGMSPDLDASPAPQDDPNGDSPKSGYDVDFSHGPSILDLDPGDKAEFLESKHPSSEMQAFSSMMIAVALKALDIPYSFYDESHTNFYGSRGAHLQYEVSAEIKRQDNRNLLDDITDWRLRLAVLDGEISLPAGKTFDQSINYEWINRGMPWINPFVEVKADAEAVKNGFKSTVQIAKEHGGDAYQNVDDEADYLKYRQNKLKGLTPLIPPTTVTVQENADA
jgi:capsid protein